MREIINFFKMNDVKYKEKFQLSVISPVKIGGRASFVAYPKSNNELILTVNFLRKNKILYKILGRMSNILPPDDKYEGVIIKTDYISMVTFYERYANVDTGVSLPYLANMAVSAGLGGLEELSGIPGSVGGAIRGNAGAFGREISELICDLSVYNLGTNEILRINADKMNFGYRSSEIIKGDMIILSAKIKLTPTDRTESQRLIFEYRQRRIDTQPVGQPSLGSVFKRPSADLSAARLIDECGLK